jgi:hypothetical protein
MSGFSKLFSSILASTVWREPDYVRVVWITMLAMKDRYGMVEASVPGLADMARVTIEQCEDALNRFRSPDPYSRTKDHEGRRIADVDGGFLILNAGKYQDLMSAEERREHRRNYMARYRAQGRDKSRSVTDMVTAGNSELPPVTGGDAGLRGLPHTDVDVDVDPRSISLAQIPPSPEPTVPAKSTVDAARAAQERDRKAIEEIYKAYPRKVARKQALAAIRKAIKAGNAPETLLARTKEYAAHVAKAMKEPQFIPYPARWFNEERFNDPIEETPAPVMPEASRTIAVNRRAELVNEREKLKLALGERANLPEFPKLREQLRQVENEIDTITKAL